MKETKNLFLTIKAFHNPGQVSNQPDTYNQNIELIRIPRPSNEITLITPSTKNFF